MEPAASVSARTRVLDRLLNGYNGVPLPSWPVFQDSDGLSLPSWVKAFRPKQWEAIVKVVAAFASGKKYVMLDAPTGSGKTLIAETVRRMLATRAIYLCSTKTLQDQFTHDFPYAALLKGRVNYPTHDYPGRFRDGFDHLTADDCAKEETTLPACPRCEDLMGDVYNAHRESGDAESGTRLGWHCPWCHPVEACPYEIAKLVALGSRLVCMNTAYYLAECNGPGRFCYNSEYGVGFPLVVGDEADLLEGQLMNFVEVNVGSKRRVQLGLPAPDVKTTEAKDHREVWGAWVARTMERVTSAHSKVPSDNNVKNIRERKSLKQLHERLKMVGAELPFGGWVYTGYSEAKDHPVIFRPVWVSKYAPDFLWKHAPRWLLMSATLLSGDLTAQELGMESGSWEFVTMGSAFPKKNRPVFIVPKANMTNKAKEEERPKMALGLDAILDRYPNERVLVHTVSYDLTSFICSNSRHSKRIITYRSAQDRNKALAEFRSTEGAVLVAPSFERGVDLPDEACRVIIICKVPYPYLGDKQVSARLHSKGGPEWYHLQTIRSIVQMSGRGVRHEEDWADTYILDEQFLQLWNKRKHWFPSWWKEAIVWNDKPNARR